MIFTKCSHAIANHISPDAAWVFGVIEYWAASNARKKKTQALKNGLYCCYMSWPEWVKELPFLSKNSIRRAVSDLRMNGLIAIFEGDQPSNRANYYAVDYKGWLKFQAWASGYVLSAEDGRALTPEDKLVPEAESPIYEDPAQAGHIIDEILPTQGIYPAHTGHPLLPTQGSMSHTLDIKRSYKDLPKEFSPRVGKASEVAPKKAPEKSGGSHVWDAYRFAYLQRYDCEPIRNKAINSICKKLHEAAGDEAVVLVQHYVSMNKRFYLDKSHPLSVCLSDIQAVKTSYATGKTMTFQQIRDLENKQTAKEVVDEVLTSDDPSAKLWAGIDTTRTIKI